MTNIRKILNEEVSDPFAGVPNELLYDFLQEFGDDRGLPLRDRLRSRRCGVHQEVEASRRLWDRMARGGIVLYDDYGTPGHREQKRALVEALTDTYVRVMGGKPDAVTILLKEVAKEDWAVAGELMADKYPD